MAEVNLLTTEAQAKLGMTHEVVITHEDLTTATDAASIEVTVTVPAGSLLLGGPHVLVTDFDSPSSTSLTYTVGDGDDADLYLSSTQIDTEGTEVDYKVATNTSIPHGKVYTSADTLDFTFDSSAGHNLDTFTAGELLYYFKLTDLASLKN